MDSQQLTIIYKPKLVVMVCGGGVVLLLLLRLPIFGFDTHLKRAKKSFLNILDINNINDCGVAGTQ